MKMAPLRLEGDTLGEKHRQFNNLVHDAVANKQTNLSKINYDATDIHNLFNIRMACKTENVDYIIEVLKCDDMLYVSTAIKHSTWLITDQEYAHIVNPQYLYCVLFPHMLTKAINKVLLHIRLHLKDENRVELFYKYIKEAFSHNEAEKWLPNCSIPFIDNILQKESFVSAKIYKRLCKRSIKFLPYYTKVKERNACQALKEVLFLLKSNIEEFLDILDTVKANQFIPPIGSKHTQLIMKKVPKRILNNFQKYIGSVDLQIVAKYIKKEDIKRFILEHANNNNTKQYFNNIRCIQHFIIKMPEDERSEFVKTIFIDKIECEVLQRLDTLASSLKTYEWYQYAPFSVALTELKQLIRAERSLVERYSMLSILVSCARKNMQHAKIILEYYYNKHIKAPFKFQIQFLNNVISNMSTHEFDSDTWNVLDNIFRARQYVYWESNHDVGLCVQAIVVYKVLHDENVPHEIERKIVYNNFVPFQGNLDDRQKSLLFDYLLTSISNKIIDTTIATETDLDNNFNLLKNALDLSKHWRRDIKEHSFIRENIQALAEIKKRYNNSLYSSWREKLPFLYDKSCRRHLFEESIMLCPSQRVCMNALKHDPQLLDRHSEELNKLRTNDAVMMRQFLTKLRVYWPHSLALQWTDAYLNNINKSMGLKGLVKGLYVLLPHNQLMEFAKKHVPKRFKTELNRSEYNQVELSKNIMKYLHMARPPLPLDILLWYAKCDYLKLAEPSLNAILHNLSKVQSRVYIPKLLKGPVPLKKRGLHLAFTKLDYEEVMSIFCNIWKTTNNSTIRNHIFIYTYNLLCKMKESTPAKNLCKIVNMFISSLPTKENKEIFNKLCDVEKVHVCVQGELYMKSYEFFTSLPLKVNCKSQKDSLIRYAPNIMDCLDGNFVIDKILAPMEQSITKHNCQYIDIISSYVLHGDTEQEQCERLRKHLDLKQLLASWDHIKNDFDALLKALTRDFRKFICLKKIIVPTKLFQEIRLYMEQKMPIEENYVRYTSWKLITEYVKLVSEHQDFLLNTRLNNVSNYYIGRKWLQDEAENLWQKLHIKLSPKLASAIVKLLKEDTIKYFPTICCLFSEALDNVFALMSFKNCLMEMKTLKYMILDDDYIPSYIVVCKTMPKVRYGDETELKKGAEILRILSAHPSREVQMHYQNTLQIHNSKGSVITNIV